MKIEQFGPTFDVRIFPFDGIGAVNFGVALDTKDGAYDGLHQDILRVETAKTLSNPVGTFNLTLTARRDSKGRTWAQRIRPMDYVEIYMARNAPKGIQSTIVMRCFVDNAFENTVVNGNRVQRVVTVNGRDYGKILLKRAVVYYNELDPTGALGWYNIGQKLGPGGLDLAAAFLTPKQFIGRIRDYLLNDPIVGAGFRSDRIPKLHSFTDIPDTHTLNFMSINPNIGAIWTFLQQWEGKPWNEMFIRDDDDFPRIYWRLAPLKDKRGTVIPHGDFIPQPNVVSGTQNYPSVDIDLIEVIHPNVGTSDNEAYSAYFAWPTYAETLTTGSGGEFAFIYPPSTLNLIGIGQNTDERGAPTVDPFAQTGDVAQGVPIGGNPIIRPDIFRRYGFNYLKQAYPLFPLPTAEEQKNESAIYTVTEAVNLAAWLHRAYSINPALESGTLELRGRPDLRIGSYVRIKDQDREFYVEAVRHSFSIVPSPTFTTSCDVTRGLWNHNNPYPELNWL